MNKAPIPLSALGGYLSLRLDGEVSQLLQPTFAVVVPVRNARPAAARPRRVRQQRKSAVGTQQVTTRDYCTGNCHTYRTNCCSRPFHGSQPLPVAILTPYMTAVSQTPSLRLERNTRSMTKFLRHATNEYRPPAPPNQLVEAVIHMQVRLKSGS